jgi:hypothetical protein
MVYNHQRTYQQPTHLQQNFALFNVWLFFLVNNEKMCQISYKISLFFIATIWKRVILWGPLLYCNWRYVIVKWTKKCHISSVSCSNFDFEDSKRVWILIFGGQRIQFFQSFECKKKSVNRFFKSPVFWKPSVS